MITITTYETQITFTVYSNKREIEVEGAWSISDSTKGEIEVEGAWAISDIPVRPHHHPGAVSD
jgi:hypothetical protein